MRKPYSRDLNRLLDLELERNERVRAVVVAYQELTEGEKTLFHVAAGITQDGVSRAARRCTTAAEKLGTG